MGDRVVPSIREYHSGSGNTVDIFDHGLERVVAAHFRDGYLLTEICNQVFQHNAVAPGKECEDVLDEVFLLVVQFLPIVLVRTEINLFRGPETGLVFLVRVPYFGVLDREKAESIRLCYSFRFLISHSIF